MKSCFEGFIRFAQLTESFSSTSFSTVVSEGLRTNSPSVFAILLLLALLVFECEGRFDGRFFAFFGV